MKDEVLQKALEADTSIIPRYDIVRSDGTKVAENVQLILKNVVLTAGTLLNKQSLLKDTTAVLYGMSAETALPDDVLVAIRNSIGYCPKLNILGEPGVSMSVQKANSSEAATTYTVPSSGILPVDILSYGTYKIQGTIKNVINVKYIDITENKQYSIAMLTDVTYVKFTATQEVGATVLATGPSGWMSSGVIGADGTCTIPLYAQGTWTCVCTYAGVASQSITINCIPTTVGTTIPQSPAWTKLIVEVTSGATVTVYKGGVSKSAVSVQGSCTFWLPDADTWSISASLGSKHGSGYTATPLYTTKTVGISLF